MPLGALCITESCKGFNVIGLEYQGEGPLQASESNLDFPEAKSHPLLCLSPSIGFFLGPGPPMICRFPTACCRVSPCCRWLLVHTRSPTQGSGGLWLHLPRPYLRSHFIKLHPPLKQRPSPGPGPQPCHGCGLGIFGVTAPCLQDSLQLHIGA